MTLMNARARFALAPLSTTAVLRAFAVLVGFLCLASVASATVWSGSFSGKAAESSSFLSLPNGTPMTGSFALNADYPFVLVDSDGSTYARYEALNFDAQLNPMHFTFAAPSLGYNWDYEGLGFLQVHLYQTAAGQRINFGTAYPKGSSAEITVTGLAGTLFGSFDLSSLKSPLNSSGLVMGESLAHLNQTAGIGNDILFSRVTFNAPIAVPEPDSALLLLIALGSLWVTSRQKCKQG